MKLRQLLEHWSNFTSVENDLLAMWIIYLSSRQNLSDVLGDAVGLTGNDSQTQQCINQAKRTPDYELQLRFLKKFNAEERKIFFDTVIAVLGENYGKN